MHRATSPAEPVRPAAAVYPGEVARTARWRPRAARGRPTRDDLRDLADRVLELALGVEEVRAEAEFQHPAGSRRGSAARRARSAPPRSPACGWSRSPLDATGRAGSSPRSRPCRRDGEQIGEQQRTLADRVHPHLLDHVVACGRRVQRGHVRRSGEEARHPGGILELGLERERSSVTLPADERRLEPLDQIGPDVEPAGAGPAAQPLDRAARAEGDAESSQVGRGTAPADW